MQTLTAEQERIVLRRDDVIRERNALALYPIAAGEGAAMGRMSELNRELSFLNRQLGIGSPEFMAHIARGMG